MSDSQAVPHVLKDALRQGLEVPRVAFSDSKPEAAPAKSAPVVGDVKVAVPPDADQDPLLSRAASAVGSGIADDLAGIGAAASANVAPVPDDAFAPAEVTLTEAEREAFLDSLVSGHRYERRFSLFGGRVTGRIRCRSTEESQAIATWMNAGVRELRFKAPLDYAVEMRNCLLAAQVMELNGTRFPALQQPLFRTQAGDTVTDPGWLAQTAVWVQQPEPVVAAVYEELRLFERKYWTMVVHAQDQNFWNPAESTSR